MGALCPTRYQLKASGTWDYLWCDQLISSDAGGWLHPRPVLLRPGDASHDLRLNATVVLSSEDFEEAWKDTMERSHLPLHQMPKETLQHQQLCAPHRYLPSRCSRSWQPTSMGSHYRRPSPGSGWRGLQPAPLTRAGTPLQGNTSMAFCCTAPMAAKGFYVEPQRPDEKAGSFC